MGTSEEVLVCGQCYVEAGENERMCSNCGTSLLSFAKRVSRSEVKEPQEKKPIPATTYATAPLSKNHKYLEKIRESSCYPTFRGFVSFCAIVGYLVALIVLIVSFSSAGSFMGFLAGLAATVGCIVLVRIGTEASLMLADIADATIDSSSKNSDSA